MSRFNHIAQYYNAMTGFPGRIDRLREAMAPWIADWNVRSALDAGCGNGVLMFALQKSGIDVVGVDVSESMLRLTLDNARELGVAVKINSASFAALGRLFSARFDAAFAIGNALVGAADDREMIASMTGLHESLKPGGRLLIQMLNLTPFLRGRKSLIMKRTVDDVVFTRFATPSSDHPGLTFGLTIDGPDKRFETHVSYWPPWDRRHVVGCLLRAGFTQVEVFGSIQRDGFDENASTDLVISAVRT